MELMEMYLAAQQAKRNEMIMRQAQAQEQRQAQAEHQQQFDAENLRKARSAFVGGDSSRLQEVAPDEYAQRQAAQQDVEHKKQLFKLRSGVAQGDPEAMRALAEIDPNDSLLASVQKSQIGERDTRLAQEKAAFDRAMEERRVSADEMRARKQGSGNPNVFISPSSGAQNPGFDSQVKAIAEYRAPMPTARNAYGQAIAQAVTQANPDYDYTHAATRLRMRENFSQSENLRNFNTAISHAGRIDVSMKALGNSGYKLSNTIGNLITEHSDDPQGQEALARFRTDAQALANEAGKVFKGTGGSTDAENRAMERVLDITAPLASQAAAARELAILMHGKIGAYEHQWDSEFKGSQPFEFISPESRETLAGFGIAIKPGATMAKAVAPASSRSGVTQGPGGNVDLGASGGPAKVLVRAPDGKVGKFPADRPLPQGYSRVQ